MDWIVELWNSLLDENSRQRLLIVGGVVSAGAVAAWTIYVHFSKKKSTLTKEEYEKGLKRLEEKLLKERATHPEDMEKQAFLEKELAALEQKRTHLEESLEATKKLYTQTAQLLEEKLSSQLPPDRIEQAKKAIAEGDPALAETLLEEVVTSGMQQSAEASYQLGLLAKDRVDYKTAWKALTRAAELAPDYALYLNEAGLMANTLGRYDTAIEYLENALASDLKTFGPDHPNVATQWNNLGEAWRQKGKYDQAIDYFEKALASDLKTFGPDHPNVAIRWNNLGAAWFSKDEVNKAIDYYNKALASDLKNLGPDHPTVAIRWNNLGLAWTNKNEFDKAIDYYNKALASDLKNLGPDHPQVAVYRNNLGEAWRQKGEYDQAIDYYNKALSSDLKTFGPDHPNVARNWNNLGLAWQYKGEVEKAREYYKKSLAVVKKAGLEHRVQLVEKNLRSLPPEK